MGGGVDDLWEDWAASNAPGGGAALEAEILSDLQASSHLFDVHDGLHAGWTGDQLGILLVFDLEEALAFASETVIDDLDESPMHDHVFGVIEALIAQALALRDY